MAAVRLGVGAVDVRTYDAAYRSFADCPQRDDDQVAFVHALQQSPLLTLDDCAGGA